MLPSPARIPHPVQDQEIADGNRQAICQARGYCGPFINEAFYNAFPDPLWQGTGECVLCCNTCNIAVEQEKRRRLEAAASASLPCRPEAAASHP